MAVFADRMLDLIVDAYYLMDRVEVYEYNRESFRYERIG